jgi:hypothetical protein
MATTALEAAPVAFQSSRLPQVRERRGEGEGRVVSGGKGSDERRGEEERRTK